MFTTRVLSLLTITLLSTCGGDPIVHLKHGGQLQGLNTTFNEHPVHVFLGIRYAEPPVGNLRFKKPQPFAAWDGIVDATNSGTMCTQSSLDGRMIGGEDCLFLDITVPGGTLNSGSKKPVMVYFYGGGFYAGSNLPYIGGPLAVEGDAIVVTVNYRLGIFGFLSDGPGTGNFGLWDQRAALLWVKENIEQFGGNPDLVTIFGESAGASSVAAHTVSPHSEGLFKRAIQQSGSLFLPWSWYLSRNARHQLVQGIRVSTNCFTEDTVYNCYRNMSTEEVHNSVQVVDPFTPIWRLVPDEDFFPSGFEENPSYELSKRFDLLSGMNAQEGMSQVWFELGAFAALRNQSIITGASLDLAREYLRSWCSTKLAPQSAELCVDFLIETYRIDRTQSNKDRVIRLTYVIGEINYNVDIVNQLRQHARSSKSTYAYYFNERYEFPEGHIFSFPRWLKRAATHTEELPFLFGAAFLKNESSSFWEDQISQDFLGTALFNQTLSPRYRTLSKEMMTLWTNFAKTGNPNTPVKPANYPEWPQFGETSGRFLDINSRFPLIINTPYKQRLNLLTTHLLVARDTQTRNDKPPASCV